MSIQAAVLMSPRITVPTSELVALKEVQRWLKDSLTLKDKIIAGKFIGFDDRVDNNEIMVALDPWNDYKYIPTVNVVTIKDGWIVADRG